MFSTSAARERARDKTGEKKGSPLFFFSFSSSIKTQRIHLWSHLISSGDAGAAAIAEALKTNTTLERLELSGNAVDADGAAALADALASSTSLKILNLSDNYIGAAGALSLASALRQNQSLVELRARANELGDEGVGAICEALAARGEESLPTESEGGGSSSSSSSSGGGIRVVDFGNNSLTSEGAAPLAKLLSNRTLRELNLYMNELGDAGAELISKSLKGDRTLRSLDLGGNGVGPDGARALADALSGNRTLSSLELGYNPIGPSGAAALAGALKHSSRVKTLKLGWCKLGGKPDEGGSVLRERKQDGSGANAAADLLMYCPSLTTLDLRGNELGPGGAAAVARALRELDSSASSSSPAAAAEGGDGGGEGNNDGGVSSPPSTSGSGGGLDELDLGYNDIKDDGACALAQALKANPTGAPRSLKVNANYLGRFGQVALTEAMDMVAELGGGRDITITF